MKNNTLFIKILLPSMCLYLYHIYLTHTIITQPLLLLYLFGTTITLLIYILYNNYINSFLFVYLINKTPIKKNNSQKNQKTIYFFSWIKGAYKKLTGSKPIEEEDDILLDHNYDGIRELDNELPPWWVYGFIITIIFSGIYLVSYHILGAPNQKQEYNIAVEKAKKEIDKYREGNKEIVDANNINLLTDRESLEKGKTIFTSKCVACHKADGGGGIGPNLTDKYWILGGGIKNIFNTISEGGRSGKGMIPWKTQLKPEEIVQVASYIISLQGTTPLEPKAAEGELWENQAKEALPTAEEPTEK